MVWLCAKIEYSRTGKEDRKVKLRILIKREWMTEDDLEDKNKKDMKDLHLQIETAEIKMNKKMHIDDYWS